MIQEEDERWMKRAISRARKAELLGEVPIGAVIVKDERIVGSGYNLRETKKDPAAHAELLAIRKASQKLGSWRLGGATLYVTLEPCIMCMGAIILARVDRLVYGCRDPKGGAAGSLYDFASDTRLNHRLPVTEGVLGGECSKMLSDFFRKLREEKKNKAESKVITIS